MNALIVSDHPPGGEYGGGEVYLRSLLAGLSDCEVRFALFSIFFDSQVSDAVLQESQPQSPHQQLRVPTSWLASRDTLITHPRLRALVAAALKNAQPTVVHAHGWKPLLASVSRELSLPVVVTAHHGGIVCPAGALLDSRDRICRLPTAMEHCPSCCLQSLPGRSFWTRLPSRKLAAGWLTVGRYLPRSPFVPFLTPVCESAANVRNKLQDISVLRENVDRFIAPSQAIADALVRNSIAPRKVRVIPHGISLPERRPLQPGLGTRPLKFIFVGRINRVKGLHVMLEAFSGLCSSVYELHIVGEGATRQEMRYERTLRARYAQLTVTWHGQKAHSEALALLAGCDVMIHPAICLEVFGLTIAEALAVGRPVVASKCGGSEMQIRHGENGFLIPPNDPVALEAVAEQLIRDPQKVRKMSEQTGGVMPLREHVDRLVAVYEETQGQTTSRLGSVL